MLHHTEWLLPAPALIRQVHVLIPQVLIYQPLVLKLFFQLLHPLDFGQRQRGALLGLHTRRGHCFVHQLVDIRISQQIGVAACLLYQLREELLLLQLLSLWTTSWFRCTDWCCDGHRCGLFGFALIFKLDGVCGIIHQSFLLLHFPCLIIPSRSAYAEATSQVHKAVFVSDEAALCWTIRCEVLPLLLLYWINRCLNQLWA